jgi:REP element-mobilizing transposase RayT
VYLLVLIPTLVMISQLLQQLKGKTACKLGEFPHLHKTRWGRNLWAQGYLYCSLGNVTDEVSAEY